MPCMYVMQRDVSNVGTHAYMYVCNVIVVGVFVCCVRVCMYAIYGMHVCMCVCNTCMHVYMHVMHVCMHAWNACM